MPFDRLISLVALICLCGCQTANEAPPPLTPEEVAQIDYGAVPENTLQLVQRYFEETGLKPGSAELRVGEPFPSYIQAGPMFGGKVQAAGYFVDVWVKLNDPASAELPEQLVGVLIRDGNVLMQVGESELETARSRSPAAVPSRLGPEVRP